MRDTALLGVSPFPGTARFVPAALLLFLFTSSSGQQPRPPQLVVKTAPRAEVFLSRPGKAAPMPVLADSDGTAKFTLSEGSDYEVTAGLGGLVSRTSAIRASTGETLTVELKLLPPIAFEDTAQRAGLDFILHNGVKGHALQPEIMLGGVAAFDYNNDGCTDLFFTNGGELPAMAKTAPEHQNRLYRNKCDGAFEDVTGSSGLAGEGYSMGVGTGDYDNDGFCDLFVTGLNGNHLYRNKGGRTFEDVTAAAGLNRETMWAVSAGWFDYDNDGYLDLFVTNYVAWTDASDSSCSAAGVPFYCHPRVYKGLPNQLFHNNRNGTFTDVSRPSGIQAHIGKGMGIAFGDYDGDGFTDVFVANDSTPNFLFRNRGNGTFVESAVSAGAAYGMHGNAVAGMGADFRDFDDDGLEDIALNAMYFDTFPLYRNQGRPSYFTDYTATSGVAIATRNLTGWGMCLCDLDNDGRKDLFYATSHFPGSDSYVHSPAAIPNHVLRNVGAGYFEDVSTRAGADFQKPALHHGAAFADFDNDGRLDAVVTAINEHPKLFRNVSSVPAHWLGIRLEGTRANRDGLGAKVRLTLPTGAQKYNQASRAVGYASSSESIVRFGLGPYEYATEIRVVWPGGHVQTLRNVTADKLITVKEE